MLSVLPPTFKPVLQQISLLQVDPNCMNTDFKNYAWVTPYTGAM